MEVVVTIAKSAELVKEGITAASDLQVLSVAKHSHVMCHELGHKVNDYKSVDATKMCRKPEGRNG
jgi:hypothetical protein